MDAVAEESGVSTASQWGSPEDDPFPPSKPLLDPVAVVLLVAALASSAWFHATLLTLTVAALLGTIVVCKLWSRWALRAFAVSQRLGYDRAFPGDEVGLLVRVENRKLLPMPWLEAVHWVSEPLRPEGTTYRHTTRTSLLWGQAATFRVPLVARRRGYYPIGRGIVSSGDVLGLFPQQLPLRAAGFLTVYPKIVPLNPASLLLTSLFGERTTRTRLLEDPTNTSGTRDYVPGDPLRHIHWKATARQPSIQVKVFRPGTSLHAMLVIDFDSFANSAEAGVELVISVAASLAQVLAHEGNHFGVAANAGLVTGQKSAAVPLAAGSRHLSRVLETLALLKTEPSQPFEDFLSRQRRDIPVDATVVCIGGQPSNKTLAALQSVQRDGNRVVLYAMDAVAGLGGVDSHSLHELLADGAARQAQVAV